MFPASRIEIIGDGVPSKYAIDQLLSKEPDCRTVRWEGASKIRMEIVKKATDLKVSFHSYRIHHAIQHLLKGQKEAGGNVESLLQWGVKLELVSFTHSEWCIDEMIH